MMSRRCARPLQPLVKRTLPSPRRTPHWDRQGCSRNANLANHLKAVPLVQRYVARVRRFEVRMQALRIDPLQGMAEQRGADALAVPDRVDADERQMPVRLVGMRFTHLLKDRPIVRAHRLWNRVAK